MLPAVSLNKENIVNEHCESIIQIISKLHPQPKHHTYSKIITIGFFLDTPTLTIGCPPEAKAHTLMTVSMSSLTGVRETSSSLVCPSSCHGPVVDTAHLLYQRLLLNNHLHQLFK